MQLKINYLYIIYIYNQLVIKNIYPFEKSKIGKF